MSTKGKNLVGLIVSQFQLLVQNFLSVVGVRCQKVLQSEIPCFILFDWIFQDPLLKMKNP